jgi:hypothetical protein
MLEGIEVPATVAADRSYGEKAIEDDLHKLKRQYGWDRTRLDGIQGARTWTGYGVLAHNLVKISAPAT